LYATTASFRVLPNSHIVNHPASTKVVEADVTSIFRAEEIGKEETILKAGGEQSKQFQLAGPYDKFNCTTHWLSHRTEQRNGR
jgi:hypothetical protein